MTTSEELESWFNHKLEVCLCFKKAPADTPCFRFKDFVLTHQDIAPRNLMLDQKGQIWLIDWGDAGIYPIGFEQAALEIRSKNMEFAEAVLSNLFSKGEKERQQLFCITYALTTGACL
jgi:thiamine kinase-like enzyme